MLEAYFDGSKRKNGLLCVAGYAFAPAQARKLTKEFISVFGPYGGFHMVDLVAKRHGYRDVTDTDGNRLIKKAVDIVKRRFSYGVAVSVDTAEFDAQAPRFIRGLGNAYPFLCHMAMTAMASLAKTHNDLGPITYTFEAGHAHEKEARFAVKLIAGHPESKKTYLHSADAFLYKADAVPLQAADLLAWESAKFKDETIDNKIRKIRLSLSSLFAANPDRYKIAFCEGPALSRALSKWRHIGYEQLEDDRTAFAAKLYRN